MCCCIFWIQMAKSYSAVSKMALNLFILFPSSYKSRRSLASTSKPQVLENCTVFGSRTVLFFELKFCRSHEKNFWRPFFLRTLAPLSLASSILVLGLEMVCSRKGCPWPWIVFVTLALVLISSLVYSNPPLLRMRKSVFHVVTIKTKSRNRMDADTL